jgi:pimeloyl-ACP methyl ester carboxylesterase
MQPITVNGIELEYQIIGSGEPLLLIDPVLVGVFEPFLTHDVLKDRFQLIRYHKRGWAGSTHTPPPVAIADHASDAAALLAGLGIERAHVAGHSSGGVVAMQLALDAPDAVHSLTLLEPSPLVLSSAPAFLEAAGPVFAAHEAGDDEDAVAMFLSAVSGLDWDECHALIDHHAPGAIAQAVQDADTLFGIELPSLTVWEPDVERMAKVTQPVLSVRGADTDVLWVEIAQQLRAWFPDVEDLVVPDAGHLLLLQRPELVADGVASFLARHAIAPAMSESVRS